ncbi:MAG TPA: alpha/beta fold hydrolase [Acidimicrobiales bacterium]
MNGRIRSGEIDLASHLAHPPGHPKGPLPAVVLCHGFPSSSRADLVAETAPELAERIATEMGWVALAIAFRGCDGSGGNFSLRGWIDDIGAAVVHLERAVAPLGTWVAGSGTGGALAICAAADDQRIQGVAALGAPGDFDDWANHPRRLLQHARDVGVISDPSFPPSLDAWARELKEVRAVACVQRYAPRPLLVVHGSEDDVVPAFDARILADAHGAAELRVIYGAGHALRHDPRAVAVLLGWLDRQRHSLHI